MKKKYQTVAHVPFSLPICASFMAALISLLAASDTCLSRVVGYETTEAQSIKVDVVIYGGTPAGIAAAIGAARDGCSVLLVEPTQRIGGMVTSGLSHTDFHTKESLSGAFLDFAHRVESHYATVYGANSKQVSDTFGGTFAEPKVNLLIFQQMLDEYPGITVLTDQRLVSTVSNSTSVNQVEHLESIGRTSIQSVVIEDSSHFRTEIRCQLAIDGTYEGDLMAMAGATWTSGREGRDKYGESLAPESADQQLQAYNFRFIMTTDPRNRVTPVAPEGYRRDDFVGVLEAIDSGQIRKVFDYPSRCIFKAHLPPLPNGKYDINDVSRNLVRLSLPGRNLDWPDGSPQQRQAIFLDHLRDQAGLLYFLQTDDAVPESFQREAREWGWCRDEFEDTNHLPPQLYVREARRLIGQHVFVQQDSEHAPNDARAVLHLDSIAMGDYGNNCHGTFHVGPRFGGTHTGEFYNPVPPYQIPYGVLVPGSIENLLVPTAVSASHVGFCGLRLEPIWMSLGQAAGHAAAQAIQRGVSVQDIPVRSLQARLHEVGSATIYISDVLPGHADFVAVQWWGTNGGLHGLEPMPEKPGQRGRKIHGQYFEANPGHEADLNRQLDSSTAQRWRVLALLTGLDDSVLPTIDTTTTRGDFIRQTYKAATTAGIASRSGKMPRRNQAALANIHPPGEVDNAELARKVVADVSDLDGIIMDDDQAILQGEWQYSTHTPPYVGSGYLHDLKDGKGNKSVVYTPDLPAAGKYEVRVSHCYNIRRATNTVITIHHAEGETVVRINQQDIPEHAGLFRTIGCYQFLAGKHGWIRISNEGTDGKYVIADAVQLIPIR